MTGVKEVLGMWAAETEGAKFRLNILTELKNRGVKDILEAIEAVYPRPPGAALHCASGAAQPEVCLLETAQGNGG